MNNSQDSFDTILSKIRANYEAVSLEELKLISEFICQRYSGGDIILQHLSNRELIRNLDYISRSYYGLANGKRIWGTRSKHYILSTLYKSSYGLDSESRKKIFVENELHLEQDNVGFSNGTGFVRFKFFVRGNNPYLFLIHEYGYNSITNKIEELSSSIEEEFLKDVGFEIIRDQVEIFYKDVGNHYDQVILQQGLKSPEWRSLENHEKIWFDQTWDSIGSTEDEPGPATYFFEKGKQFDAYTAIRSILVNAKKELFIVDNYIDSSLFFMLETVSPGVSIKLMTSRMHGDAPVAAEKFKAQRGNFEWCKAQDFHDRYIFSDNECYLLGASVKDFANKATTLVAIREKPVIKLIKSYALDKFNGSLALKPDQGVE